MLAGLNSGFFLKRFYKVAGGKTYTPRFDYLKNVKIIPNEEILKKTSVSVISGTSFAWGFSYVFFFVFGALSILIPILQLFNIIKFDTFLFSFSLTISIIFALIGFFGNVIISIIVYFKVTEFYDSKLDGEKADGFVESLTKGNLIKKLYGQIWNVTPVSKVPGDVHIMHFKPTDTVNNTKQIPVIKSIKKPNILLIVHAIAPKISCLEGGKEKIQEFKEFIKKETKFKKKFTEKLVLGSITKIEGMNMKTRTNLEIKMFSSKPGGIKVLNLVTYFLGTIFFFNLFTIVHLMKNLKEVNVKIYRKKEGESDKKEADYYKDIVGKSPLNGESGGIKTIEKVEENDCYVY